MHKILIKFIYFSPVLIVWLALPSILYAQTEGEVVPLTNPLAFGNFTDFLAAILGVVMVIAVPIIIFFLIYAGFLYVTAQGNSEQVQKATRALLYAVIGGLLILGAQAISIIIKNIVSEFSSTPSTMEESANRNSGSFFGGESESTNTSGGSIDFNRR